MTKPLSPFLVLCLCFTISHSLGGWGGHTNLFSFSTNTHCHHWDFQKNSAFEEAGVREPELSQINRAKFQLLAQIKNYFVYNLRTPCTKNSIYNAAVAFKRILEVVEEKYWSDEDNIVIGDKN